MHFTIDKNTRQLVKLHIQNQILKIKAIKHLGHS
jgi:hypothetical protein